MPTSPPSVPVSRNVLPTRFLTVAEVAEALRISVRQVQREIAAGRLNAHRFGRLVRVSVHDLEEFIRRPRILKQK